MRLKKKNQIILQINTMPSVVSVVRESWERVTKTPNLVGARSCTWVSTCLLPKTVSSREQWFLLINLFPHPGVPELVLSKFKYWPNKLIHISDRIKVLINKRGYTCTKVIRAAPASQTAEEKHSYCQPIFFPTVSEPSTNKIT